MNSAGNIAGFVAPPTVAYLLSWTGGNWEITFYVSAAIYFVAALAWLFIDPVSPLDN
jgi:sugar phosphate permease